MQIASTSYARPAPEQYGHVMKGEAMQKNRNLTDISNSGSNKKMKSDVKDELVEDDEHFPIDYDDPLLKEKKAVNAEEFETFPDFPIYDEPLLKSKKTVGDEPKP